jgi:hypothetical protein
MVYDASDYLVGSGAGNGLEGPIAGGLFIAAVASLVAVTGVPPFRGADVWTFALLAARGLPGGAGPGLGHAAERLRAGAGPPPARLAADRRPGVGRAGGVVPPAGSLIGSYSWPDGPGARSDPRRRLPRGPRRARARRDPGASGRVPAGGDPAVLPAPSGPGSPRHRHRRDRPSPPGRVTPTTWHDLVERLPEILADRVRAPGPGRMPSMIEPGELHRAPGRASSMPSPRRRPSTTPTR